MEKEQGQNLPGRCRGWSGLKEKRSIPISTSGASIAVLGQANAVQSPASTIQLSYSENEGQVVCYHSPLLCMCLGSFK